MAKQLLQDGAIGQLARLESQPGNIYDMGTHWLDMFNLFLGEVPARWVLAQIDYRKENIVFGQHCENQQIVLTEYENGVFGLLMGGAGGASPLGCTIRLCGTEGTIELGTTDGINIRYQRQGEAQWTLPDTKGESLHGPGFIERAMADVVACLQEGRKCQLDATNALLGTEIIFGAYESSRRRGRVDFPLEIDDTPLAAMVANGDLTPQPAP
jgi:predicted dehydrogenase